MNIWRRLRFFALGIGIGSLMVLFLFGDRGCGGFLPERRIKDTITTRRFTSSELIDCKIQCNGYSVESLTEFIENADIDFKNSKKTTDPQEYIFQNEGKTLVFAIPKDYDMPVYLVDSFDVECIECDTLSSTYDQDLKFPFRKKKW
ncbi:MAG: hypothetical protein P8N07_03200 [Flavobacteriales bacterium]|jgi:hypothetical protein|nr:hypothetical protein [Flavobacteriales bacterium]MDG1174785.1 hypothetical protein [Flavobacteriales bacterium]